MHVGFDLYSKLGCWQKVTLTVLKTLIKIEHLHMFAYLQALIVLLLITILIFFGGLSMCVFFLPTSTEHDVITQLRTYLNSLKYCKLNVHYNKFE